MTRIALARIPGPGPGRRRTQNAYRDDVLVAKFDPPVPYSRLPRSRLGVRYTLRTVSSGSVVPAWRDWMACRARKATALACIAPLARS